MNYLCPVCFFAEMPYPPRDYDICPCCGTEFGNDDAEFSYDELRSAWISNGAPWFFEHPPAGWSPWLQLIGGGRQDLIPPQQISLFGSVWENVEVNDEASIESNVMENNPHENVFSFSTVA
jgi:hypothetical protein